VIHHQGLTANGNQIHAVEYTKGTKSNPGSYARRAACGVIPTQVKRFRFLAHHHESCRRCAESPKLKG
jgi:hypothetical protein